MQAFPSGVFDHTFQKPIIHRCYSYHDSPEEGSKPINVQQKRYLNFYEPDQSSFKKITPEDPVYCYQNLSFDEIFGDRPVSPRVMTPTQSSIRKSIIAVSERKNSSFSDDSPLTLDHVSSTELISERLNEFESKSKDLKFVAAAVRSLVEKAPPTDDEFDPLKYNYEMILKGIETGNILNVIYLILGFNEEEQESLNAKYTGQGSRLFNRDHSGKFRIELVNQKLLTINFSKLLIISEDMPFRYYQTPKYNLHPQFVAQSGTYQQLGQKRPISAHLGSQDLYNHKIYTSTKTLFDELISDLSQRNYHVFDSKVNQLNAFNFNNDSVPSSMSKKRLFDNSRIFVPEVQA